jgi:divalent metal cation (Fe/Co/Zn/Cd) transporter
MSAVVATPRSVAALQRRVRLIVAATITYNVVEAAVAITAGTIASSAALVGFGLDSILEVLSAAAIAWQFAGSDHQARERVALRVVAVSFFALAAYVTVDAIRALTGAAEAERTTVGIVLAAVSLVVMPFLSLAERRTGRQLGSASVVADSKQTLVCTYLSAVLLVGLVLNSTLGWAWADPLAALVIAAVALREGVAAWRGDSCCASAGRLLGADAPSGEACGGDCCKQPTTPTVSAPRLVDLSVREGPRSE